MRKRLLMVLAALCLALCAAASSFAQSAFQTPQSAAGGPSVPGVVHMCLNASGLAVPCGGTASNSQLATYSVAATGFASYATPTDIFCLSGSDTKTVRVINSFLAIQSTAGAATTWFWIKRTTADTGGSPTTPTPVAVDSADAAPTSVLKLFTAAPSGLGTSAGNLLIQTVLTATLTATATIMIPTNYINGTIAANLQTYSKPLTLHGSAESYCLNFNGAALPAGFASQYLITWTESNQ